MQHSLQARIQDRAYHIWNATGRVEGQAEQHWIAAEREVLAEMASTIPTTQDNAGQTAAAGRKAVRATRVRKTKAR